MDALVEAAVAARDARRDGTATGRDGTATGRDGTATGRDGTATEPARIVLVPTAVARHRPDLAVAHGRAAFEAAATRCGLRLQVDAVPVFDRASAADPDNAALLEQADLVHLPGGDPDLVPLVLRETPAWTAIGRAFARGACVAGASAGAMALAERLWTRDGPAIGLGLVPGVAVLPHFDPGRLAAWRAAVDPDNRLAWLGLDERTLVIGPPGGPWTVRGQGRAHLVPPGGAQPVASAANGASLVLPVG
jgi:cyanophycinase-like exopeptidase